MNPFLITQFPNHIQLECPNRNLIITKYLALVNNNNRSITTYPVYQIIQPQYQYQLSSACTIPINIQCPRQPIIPYTINHHQHQHQHQQNHVSNIITTNSHNNSENKNNDSVNITNCNITNHMINPQKLNKTNKSDEVHEKDVPNLYLYRCHVCSKQFKKKSNLS